MSTAPKSCVVCGLPIERRPGSRGKLPKVHPGDCLKRYRAVREQMARRRRDPLVGSPEREARKLAAYESLLLRRERVNVRRGLGAAGLLDPTAKDVVPIVGRHVGPPKGTGWENGRLVGVHVDHPQEIVPTSVWRALIHRAARAISAATADVARSFLQVWHADDRSSAARHLHELIEDGPVAAEDMGFKRVAHTAGHTIEKRRAG